MAVTLTVNGTRYNYPETGDQNWGGAATAWAQAVTAGMLQKAGGSFILTAEVDFGASFGVQALYFRSRDATVASAGRIRFSNNQTAGDVNWRNAADSADLKLYVDASDDLIFDQNGTPLNISAASSGNVTGPGSATDNALARFDLTTGQLIQNSGATLDDSDILSTVGLLLTGLTASRALQTDGSKNLESSSVTTTELGHLSGVTSALQTQLDAKAAGAASSTDNAIPKFDSTTGKILQNSGLIIDDSNNLSGVAALTASGAITLSGTSGHSVAEEFANEVWEEYARPTGTSPGTRGVAISSSSGTFTDATDTYSDVTNLSVTIVTNGRPVLIKLVSATTSGTGAVSIFKSGADSASIISGNMKYVRDGSTDIAETTLQHSFPTDTDSNHGVRWPTEFIAIDTPGAGTYTYKLQVHGDGTGAGSFGQCTLSVIDMKLVVYEL